MNLHIIQEGVINEAFYNNIEAFGLLSNNKFFIRHSKYYSGRMDKSIPYGKLTDLKSQIGNTKSFDRVFIHQLSPLYYRWIQENQFNELNWLIWGADLYHLPFITQPLFEPLTYEKYVKTDLSFGNFLFRTKYCLTNKRYKVNCYSKIDRVLTWMPGEYDFAKRSIPELRARYDFFIYENKIPYTEIAALGVLKDFATRIPKLIIGNSGTPTNNHLDAVQYLIDQDIKADILLPLSYGEKKYIQFLKKSLRSYKNGTVTFLEDFLPIDEYLKLLQSSDGLVMNSLRPQGYGNIFMMMLVNKPVFFNSKNYSLTDLDRYQIEWRNIDQIKQYLLNKGSFQINNSGLLKLTSKENLKEVYVGLFG